MGIKHKAVKSANQQGLSSEWNDEHKIDSNLDITPFRIAGGDPINASDYATKNYVDGGGFLPIGSVVAWLKNLVGISLPAEWVECNGQILSDAESIYNGQTIPNLNGETRFLIGQPGSGGRGGSPTIDITHAHTGPSHTHTFADTARATDSDSHTHNWSDTSSNASSTSGTYSGNISAFVYTKDHTHTVSGTTDSDTHHHHVDIYGNTDVSGTGATGTALGTIQILPPCYGVVWIMRIK